ncbi:hypothetical protein [Streptomyces sp. SAS_260]|uniref:hypothetical protein n=1 Tax=Streptomyces sp. SAS_260 TaxID=3412751 RepID=UPI00403CFED3
MSPARKPSAASTGTARRSKGRSSAKYTQLVFLGVLRSVRAITAEEWLRHAPRCATGVAAVHGLAASQARWSAAVSDTNAAATPAHTSSVTHHANAATGTRPALWSAMTGTRDDTGGTSVP